MSAESQGKKKILHIIDSFGGGGAETWLLAAVKYLAQHPELNIQFDFLASGGKEGIYDAEIKQHGSQIFYCKYSLRHFFRFSSAFKRILRDNKYIALHNHQDFISGWHFLAGKGQLPAIRIAHLHNPYNFVHNYVTNPMRWCSFRIGRLLMVKLATAITGTSNEVMDEYGYDKQPYSKKRVKPAYCGFDTTRFIFNKDDREKIRNELGWSANDNIALFAGRIGLHDYDTALNQKNPEFAFELAKELVQQYRNWKFIFAGYKGKLGDEMERFTVLSGLGDSIKFLGIRKDMPSLMSAADVLVLPSLWEGLGMVAVEAQACGLPVLLSSTVPAEAIICKELVQQFKLEEGTAAWVQALQNVAENSNVSNRKNFAENVSASPFSIQHSVNTLSSLYNL